MTPLFGIVNNFSSIMLYLVWLNDKQIESTTFCDMHVLYLNKSKEKRSVSLVMYVRFLFF
jgi:hypothetical protein